MKTFLSQTWTRTASLILASRLMDELRCSKRDERDRDDWSAVETVLAGLLAAHPEPPAGARSHLAYARLSSNPDRTKINQLFKQVGEREASTDARKARPWTYNPWHRMALLIEDAHKAGSTESWQIRLESPNQWIDHVTVELAGEVYQRVAGAHARDEDVARNGEEHRVLAAAVERWRKATLAPATMVLGIYKYGVPCARCRSGWVPALRPDEHLVFCPGHPASSRLERLRLALRVAQVLVPWEGRTVAAVPLPSAEPEPRRPKFISHAAAQEALESFIKGEDTPDRDGISPSQVLSAVLVEWQRALDPDAVSCPMCKKPVGLYALTAHIAECPAHPAAAAASQIMHQIRESAGLRGEAVIELILEHQKVIGALRHLTTETEQFSNNQGWSGEAAYIKEPSERPWLESIGSAATAISLAHCPDEVPDGGDTPLRQAFRRLLQNMKLGEGIDDDLLVLKSAAKELDAFVARSGRDSTCPACGRAGLHPARLVHHLQTCRAHPANAEGRALLALLRTIPGAEAIEARCPDTLDVAIEPLDPRVWMDEKSGQPSQHFFDWARDNSLCELEKKASYDEKNRRAWIFIWRFIDELERFRACERQVCPSCGVPLSPGDAPGHLISCEEHPARKFVRSTLAALRAEMPRQAMLLGELRRETDRAAMALAGLVDACRAYWSATTDGPDLNKSYMDPRQEKMWKRARDLAQAELNRFDASNVLSSLGLDLH